MTAEQVTPEELAVTFEQTATWMATRPAGVTWTGDGLDGTVAGLRDAAKSIRKQLTPAWDALTRERDAAQAANAALKEQLTEARAGQAEALSSASAARAESEGYGMRLDRLRITLDRYREALEFIRGHVPAGRYASQDECTVIRDRARVALEGP